MKKIDKLLLSSFLPPFVVTFFIALFVLIMQYLWLYIDDIIGKGAGFFFLMEMIFYLSVSLIPMALPIAVLISSVMVLGNLAERYELSSMKSAGVPLLRIMRSPMIFCLAISGFSFICSNYLIPVANLKFQSRLYNVKQHKPALSLEEGVFNDDFEDFIIRIGDKEKDNSTINDVLIYNLKENNGGAISQIVADKGQMYTTEDKRYLIMKLQDGIQYQETTRSSRRRNKNSYPFVRTSFREWNKVFDLSEFEINWMDENLFKSHHKMMSVAQLAVAIDSIKITMQERKNKLSNYTARYIRFLQNDTPDTGLDSIQQKKVDSLRTVDSLVQVNPAAKDSLEAKRSAILSKVPGGRTNQRSRRFIPKQEIENDLATYSHLGELFVQRERAVMLRRAQDQVRSIKNQAIATNSAIKRLFERRVKHIFELHIKFSMAIICFIFLFIGAPMGAIVRKGGFGYPILIAIIFFMIYIIMNITFKNVAEQGVMNPVLASWLPCLILFPIGLWLTIKAMNDSKLLNVDRIVVVLRHIAKWIRRTRGRDEIRPVPGN